MRSAPLEATNAPPPPSPPPPASAAPRSSSGKWLDHAGLIAIALAIGALGLFDLLSHDLWWQLAAGEWVLAHGWPDRDPFSYAFPERPWIELRWLFCVCIHLVERTLGLEALVVGKVLVLLSAFGALAMLPGVAPWARNMGLLLALALAQFRFQVRPELVSFLGVTWTLLVLERYRQGGRARWLALLPVGMIVWTNAHTTFVLGPVLAWLFLAGEELAARWSPLRRLAGARILSGARRGVLALAALAMTLAPLLNPWHVDGLLFPLQLLRQISGTDVQSADAISLKEVISEFRGPFAEGEFSFLKGCFLAVIACSAASFALAGRRVPPGRALVWVAFLGLAALAVRNLALFGLVAAWTTALNLSEAGRWQARLAGFTRPIVLLVAATTAALVPTDYPYHWLGSEQRFGVGVSTLRHPRAAMDFVRAEGLPRPVIGELGDSGYLLFEGGPRSVFIDGRLEVYGVEDIVRAVRLLLTGSGFDALTRAHGVHTAVVRQRNSRLIAQLEAAADWVPVYHDHLNVVYLRDDPSTQALVARLRIDWRDPPPVALPPGEGLAHQRLGAFYAARGQVARARTLFEEAARKFPNEETRLYLGLLLRIEGEDERAARLLARVRHSVWQRPDVHTLEGNLSELQGQPRRAIACHARALELAQGQGSATRAHHDAVTRAALAAGELERALRALQETVRVFPQDPGPWAHLAKLLVRQGALREAIAPLRNALALAEAQPRLHHLLGVVHTQLGEWEPARRALERALELDPSLEDARRDLERLDRRAP